MAGRFESTYFQLYNGQNELISGDKYIAGDACRRDEDGYYWITGRCLSSTHPPRQSPLDKTGTYHTSATMQSLAACPL